MSGEFCGQRKVIDVEEKKLDLTRRNFLTAVATAAGSIGLTAIASSAQAAGKKYKVCSTKDVNVAGAAIFRIAAAGGIMVLITQPKKGTFRAFNPSCTHEGFRLSGVNKTNLICEKHGALFDTNSGAVTKGPARTPLKKYTLTLEGSTVYITV